MRSKFDEEMALLHRELTQMGALCEEAIALTAQALDGDRGLADRVPALEGEIDQMDSSHRPHVPRGTGWHRYT